MSKLPTTTKVSGKRPPTHPGEMLGRNSLRRWVLHRLTLHTALAFHFKPLITSKRPSRHNARYGIATGSSVRNAGRFLVGTPTRT